MHVNETIIMMNNWFVIGQIRQRQLRLKALFFYSFICFHLKRLNISSFSAVNVIKPFIWAPGIGRVHALGLNSKDLATVPGNTLPPSTLEAFGLFEGKYLRLACNIKIHLLFTASADKIYMTIRQKAFL